MSTGDTENAAGGTNTATEVNNSGSVTTLPNFRHFEIDSEPTSLGVRWKKWLLEFENLIVALNVLDKKRQRA